MAHVSNIEANNTSYGIRATAIPYGVVDSTSTSTKYTATVPGITELTDGVCCLIKNGKVTSESGFTLNVNGLGAKPSYSNMATGNPVIPTNPTRDTTIFNINYTMLFIYNSTIVSGGAWICYRGYDANTNTIGYQVRSNSHSLPASQKFYRYRLLFTSADGTHYVPANTSSSTNATASRTVNQTPIDPFGHIVYYGTTAAVEANARPAASSLWVIYTLSLGYSFNRTGAALTLDDWAPVYLKCAPQSNGSAIIDETTPYVQALPNTNDGKIYIFLGVAYNATSIELLNSHPVYYHDGTGIRVWTGKKIATKVSELTNDSGFITSSSLNGYATESYVDNKVPFIANVTISTNPSTGTVTASSITTHAQIKEAVAAGRSVYVKTSIGTVLHLMYINNDEAHFSIVGESSGWKMQQISCTSSNVWSVVNSGLAAVATSGSYNDLTDQPNIPSIAGLATETYVNTAVSNLVDSAPQTLDTLNELAAALGDDPNFATTVSTELGSKVKFVRYEDADEMDADTSQPNGTIGYDANNEDFYIYESANREWRGLPYIANLASVAISGNYNDLSNQPTIPAAVTVDSSLTGSSQTNPVQGGAIYTALQGKVPTSRKINNKALSADITLTASDVGAMSTSHPANAITSAKITEWDGKADKTFVVNIEDDGNDGYTCDKTNAEIYAAWQAGREVICIQDGEWMYHLACEPSSTFVCFASTSYDEIDTVQQTLIQTDNNVQTVTVNYFSSQVQLQSGTNIKTINNQSLLGSGNLTASDVGAEDRQKVVVKITNISVNNVPTFVDANNNALTHAQVKDLLDNLLKDVIIYWTSNNLFYSLYYAESGDDEYYFSALSADDSYVYWINLTWDSSNNTFDFDNGNYTMQQLLVSGTNIKTINNQSLLGSGNLTASDIGALPSNTHIPNDIKVGSVAGKLYRDNVGGSGNFSISGNSGCIPNLTAGTFLVSIYAKSDTQSYTFRFNFGSVTYDLSTTNGEINDIRQITIPSSGTFSGSVLNGSVASGTILYVVMYDYLTPVSTVGVAAVTNRYADLDGIPSLATVATSGSYNDLTNKPTIPTPVDGIASITTSQNGTVTITLTNGDAYTIDLNHQHSQYLTQHQSLSGYLKYELLADQLAYTTLQNKDSNTLYLIPESND